MKLFKKDYKAYSDEDLMRFFLKGDRKAFEQIYDRYEKYMINFFYRKLWSDREKASDFTHDLFTKLIDNPKAFDPSRSFKTWLFSLANNMCKNEYKKQEIRKPTSYDIPEGVDPKSGTVLPDSQVDKNNFNEQLKTELDKLNEKHRQVFMLRHFEGLSLKEIAEILEINNGTVKSRLHFATKTLASKLEVYRKTLT
ncbi:RNA polymerase sigma factor [Crocinitomix algicola]|uniref:RNA polymerase sigma factor n=1 Tax=Crocinitomix algicola TaxID=1740263 RepID=UPI00082DAA11|nr:RNA polymerase sigma factor [Crocinitomix algicola]